MKKLSQLLAIIALALVSFSSLAAASGSNCPSIVVGGSNQVTIPAGIPLQLFVWPQSYSTGGGSWDDPVSAYRYIYFQCVNGAWTQISQ